MNQNIIDQIKNLADEENSERFMFKELWVGALQMEGIVKDQLTEKEYDQLIDLLEADDTYV